MRINGLVLISFVLLFFAARSQEKQTPDVFDGYKDIKFFNAIEDYKNYNFKLIDKSSFFKTETYSAKPLHNESIFLETKIDEIRLEIYKNNIIKITLLLEKDVNEIVKSLFKNDPNATMKDKSWVQELARQNIWGLKGNQVFGYEEPYIIDETYESYGFVGLQVELSYGRFEKTKYSHIRTGRREYNKSSGNYEETYNREGTVLKKMYYFSIKIIDYEKIIDKRQVETNYDVYLSNLGVTSNQKTNLKEIKIEKPVNSSISSVDINIPDNGIVNNNSFALIIGNENYQNEKNVPYAINDAKIIKQYFYKTLGIPEKNIRLSIDATFGKMINDIDWLKKIIEIYGTNASIFFYYAGHGVPNETTKGTFILPVDGVSSNTRTGISLEDIYNDLSEKNANSLTFFLDACFSGDSRSGMLQSSRAVRVRPKNSLPKNNTVVFSATTADETAFPLDSENHGLFTYYLLKAIQESKGNINYNSLFEYLNSNIPKKSLNNNNRVQTPSIIVSQDLIDKWKSLYLIK